MSQPEKGQEETLDVPVTVIIIVVVTILLSKVISAIVYLI